MNPYVFTTQGQRRVAAIARESNMLYPRLKKGQKTSAARLNFAQERVSNWADVCAGKK